MEMLLNKNTGVISVEGDVMVTSYDQDFYINVNVEEIEVEGGFKLVGETQDGEKVEAFLSTEEYFEGKNFVVATKVEEKVDNKSLGDKIIEILNEDENAKKLINITKQTMIEQGYEVNGEDWQDVMQTIMILCIKGNEKAFETFTKHMYKTLREA